MRAIFLTDDSVAAPVRMEIPCRELRRRGYDVTWKMYPKVEIDEPSKYDLVVLQRPVNDLRKVIDLCYLKKRRVVVDIDDDFMAIPKEHPGFKIVGMGNHVAIENLLHAISMADLLTVSTEELAKRYAPLNDRTKVIPNVWDDNNPIWERKMYHDMINVGWCGSLTHHDDVFPILPTLLRLTKEYPNVRIVIGADFDVYRALRAVPERQKMFVPGMQYDDYPWMIKTFDILLAPLRDTEFNAAKSDIKLVDAGAASIPFVCSDVPCYRQAVNGAGLRVLNGEWFLSIANLLDYEEFRKDLGVKGHQLVDERRVTKQSGWEEVLKGV